MSTSNLSGAIEWLQEHLEPADIFTEVQLRTWALENGMVDDLGDEIVSVVSAPRHDSPLDELYESWCPMCLHRYKILNAFLGGAEIECKCGIQDVNFAEEGEEEMVRY